MQYERSEEVLGLIRQQISRLKDREGLIVSHRVDAYRIARSLLRKTERTLDEDDLRSVVDLALVEAANKYVQDNRVKFTTFLFYYLKGRILRALCKERYWDNHHCKAASSPERIEDFSPDSVSKGPDLIVEYKDIQINSHRLIECLPRVEREVLFAVYYRDMTLELVAKELGYSRAHIGRIRDRALSRLRLGRLNARSSFRAEAQDAIP